jgi:hypothetical protein
MNKIMEKEWFNGFVANGLQFRLDGYKINIQGITYHICVKNISGSEIEIDNKIYFRFDGKRVLKRNAAGQTYIEGYESAVRLVGGEGGANTRGLGGNELI